MEKILRLEVDGTLTEIPVNGRIVTYEELSGAIGGYLEHITFNRKLATAGIDMWCDEEGRLKDLQTSCLVVDVAKNQLVEDLVGPIVFTARGSYDDGESYSVTDEQVALIKETLLKLPDGMVVLPWK